MTIVKSKIKREVWGPWVLALATIPHYVWGTVIAWGVLWPTRLGRRPKWDRGAWFTTKNLALVHWLRGLGRRLLDVLPGLSPEAIREHPWGGTALLGAGIWIGPGASERLKRHEIRHVVQLKGSYLAAGVIAAVLYGAGALSWPWALGVWGFGWVPWTMHYWVAFFSGERAYRDSENERSAYAVTNIIKEKHVGKAWIDILNAQQH